MRNRIAGIALAAALSGVFAASPTARAASEASAGLDARLARLEANVAAAEDVSAIKRLQRAYGYYLDKGMWEDLAALFTEDAVANYPAGVFVGRASIRRHVYMNVGGGKVGDLGLGDGRLYNHMSIQPVIHLDPDGRSAKGRWRAFAMFGSFGGGAMWAEGVYEMEYAKENGVWKIRRLEYHSGFGAPYRTGWVAPSQPRAPGSRPRRNLAHPPDRERKMACEGFPAACIAPFHYENPGRSLTAARVWPEPDGDTEGAAPADASAGTGTGAGSSTGAQSKASARSHADARVSARAASGITQDSRKRIADLAHRAMLLHDEQQIENLQRIYGYYLDRALWDQVADLFAEDGTIEMGLRGIYVGKRRIREFLNLLGPHGLRDGWLNEHPQLQILVTVAPDGLTAHARSRELGMTGIHGSHGTWSEGVYENTYVKQNGVWKFKSLRFYPTFISDYDKGWAQDAQPPPPVSTTLPPDRPPTDRYEIYPKAHVPPFHYRNPVTGEAPRYPAVGGPDKRLAAAALQRTGRKYRAPAVKDVEAALAQAEKRIQRVKDFHELENLESAYGYYLDKNLWNDLADLFARDGSMELAQRGVYKGRERVREFLVKVFGRGREGPVEGRLGNHIQIQPVISISGDGTSARIRVRMLQQMSFGSRASLGAAVYENEAVKEDGVWKLKTLHAYNTFAAGYEGGWAKSASRGVPGPSRDLPPDAPPTMVFEMFPVVYDIPFHYENPVTGRTEMPAIVRTLAAASGAPSPGASSAGTSPPGMPPDIATALREIGPRIDPQRTTPLYIPLHPKEPYEGVSLKRDVAYGPHKRHRLDIFTSAGKGEAASAQGKPILVFIHGGGFTRGAKHTPGSPFYDNVGLWAAKQGFVGVTINYRLAPEYQFPSGIEDVERVVAWLKAHGAEYGGDPATIVLWGHSAGAAHAADYIARQALTDREPAIAGAILTSGFYELGDKVSVWKDYYGEDVSKYKERSSLAGLVKSSTPLLVVDAELDPDTFRPDSDRLADERAKAGRPVRRVRLPGHSHLSELYAVGTADESHTAPVLEFVRSLSAQR